jgi:hypothetical protein
MRALTVRQPHATAIIRMGKPVENRTRNIAGNYRGPVAIHAGIYEPGRVGQRTMFDQDLEVERDKGGLLLRSKRLAWPYRLPLGVIIGVVDLTGVHHADEGDMRGESAVGIPDGMCSPWAQSNHWHLVFENPRVLARPIPYKGQLGLWTLPDDVLAGAL